jgi:hypothetical protein
MSNILTANEVSNYKDIGAKISTTGSTSTKIDVNKINSVLNEVQLINLKEVLGDRFYFDLISNLDNPTYQDLLSGSTFQYCGITYIQEGIKSLLADYFMAKYVLVVNTNFTPFGATAKHSESSEPADRNSLKDISANQSQLAGAKLEIIRYYLDSNPTLFPNWKHNTFTSESGNSTGERRFRFKKL